MDKAKQTSRKFALSWTQRKKGLKTKKKKKKSDQSNFSSEITSKQAIKAKASFGPFASSLLEKNARQSKASLVDKAKANIKKICSLSWTQKKKKKKV